jgi:hypothetical protein
MSMQQQMQALLLADQIRQAYRNKRGRDDDAAPGEENDEEDDEDRPRRARRTAA